MNVLILGQAKTATTYLTYTLLQAVPDGEVLFEPKSAALELQTGVSHVVKVIFEHLASEELERLLPGEQSPFDKAVLIVRDPRDNFISRLLYQVFNCDPPLSRKNEDKWLQLLRQKEKHPEGLGTMDLVREWDALQGGDFLAGTFDVNARMLDFYSTHRERLFLLRYEDLLEGRLDGLQEHLGLCLESGVEVPQQYSRVVRSKKYGNWRRWFTQQDCDCFRNGLSSYMQTFGYDPDCHLEKHPRLDPAQGSEYVARLLRERRKAHSPLSRTRALLRETMRRLGLLGH